MVPFIKNLRLPLNIIVYDIHFKIYWKYKAAKIVDNYFDFKPKSIAKHYKSRSLIRTFIRNGFFKKFDFCRGCRGRLKRTELLSNIKWFVRIHFFGLSTWLKLVVAVFKRIFRYFPFLKHAFQSRPKITQQQSCQFFTVKFKKTLYNTTPFVIVEKRNDESIHELNVLVNCHHIIETNMEPTASEVHPSGLYW